MPVSPFFGVFALTADVRKTVLAATTGDDQPWPGTSTTHFTCSVFDHVSGSFASSASPFISGPRNPGHDVSGADDNDVDVTAMTTSRSRVRARSSMREGTPVRPQ